MPQISPLALTQWLSRRRRLYLQLLSRLSLSTSVDSVDPIASAALVSATNIITLPPIVVASAAVFSSGTDASAGGLYCLDGCCAASLYVFRANFASRFD